MNTPLVIDGFPRADLDVPTIRQVRQQIIMLRNDLKQVMKEIEQDLHNYFRAPNGNGTSHEKASTLASKPSAPFAVVNRVVENSPAEKSGFVINDLIVSFGDVKELDQCSSQVKDGIPINVKVLREGYQESIELTLVPNSNWGGSGSIGLGMAPL